MKKKKLLFACLSLAMLMTVTSVTSCSKKKTDSSEISQSSSSSSSSNENIQKRLLRIHYYRDDGNYKGWNIWLWDKAKGNGSSKLFTGEDDYGVYAEIDLDEYAGCVEFGIIIRLNEWEAKDGEADRFFELDADSVGEEGTDIYLVGGVTDIFNDQYEAIKSNVKSAYFKDSTTIFANLFLNDKENALTASDIVVEENGNRLDLVNVDITKTSITIKIADDSVKYNALYTLKVNFDNGEAATNISKTNLYSQDGFYDQYTYYGDDLGANLNETKTSTTFKLWAPISKSVTLNLYSTGTPKSISPKGSDTPIARYEMKLEQQGVWGVAVPENLHGTYYTYTVDNGYEVNEVVDPYAKSCGINGLRGLVVDFDAIDEEIGWDTVNRPDQIKNPVDQNIYELHIRDMTVSDTAGTKDMTFGGTDYSGKKLKGTYLALGQTGTKYTDGNTTVSTGIDHLKELGVNTVQIQPMYDFASVDETNPSRSYNWGYDPLNYNCLDGSYSINPQDGLSRIKEFKTTMKSFCENGINVNMDVVYNHTYSNSDTNFEKIIPGYYHRMTSEGAFSNGSGCGNEMASEKPMYRKFVVDSLKFWCDTYNISGFRFDLMKLLDTVTMEEAYKECKKIYPNVTIYGEPWTGGTSTSTYTGVDQTTLVGIEGVGAFNDQIRNAVRGGNDQGATGWIQDGRTGILAILNGIKGTFKGGKVNPDRTINYVACHDNYCLFDQVNLSSDNTETSRKITQAEAMITLAEGIPFIYEGDEFLRTKNIYGTEIVNGIDEKGQSIHNTYNCLDYNTINWANKIAHSQENKVQGDLFKLRNEHKGFKLTTYQDVNKYLEVVKYDEKTIAYKINYDGETLYVIHSQNGGEYNLGEEYTKIFDNVNGIDNVTNKVSSYTFNSNETCVFVK